MESFWSGLKALISALAPFKQALEMAPFVHASISDIPGCNVRRSKAERLQETGWFRLTLSVEAPIGSGATIRNVFIFGAERMRSFPLPYAIAGKGNFRESVLIHPKNPEEGTVWVLVQLGLLSFVLKKCPYRRTHWMGE